MQAESRGEFNQLQVDSGKGRSQYFEKLTIGCGAAIAAIVSFLGGSNKHALHPTWVLRCSLVALAVAMRAALYRNCRYQNYWMAFDKRAYTEALRDEERCRNDLFQVVPAHSWEDGKPIRHGRMEQTISCK